MADYSDIANGLRISTGEHGVSVIFSVVIPLYNKEKTISRALGSVLAQTRTADEVIVVNDGSTDGSGEIAERYAAQGVRVIHQDNKGVSAARNRGINEAKSTHVAFLDADDHWLPNHLDILGRLVIADPLAALISTRHANEEVATQMMAVQREISITHSTGCEFLKIYAKDYSVVNSSTAVARRDLLLEIGGFPGGVSRGEDVMTWLRLGELGTFAFTSQVSVLCDRSGESRTSAGSLEVVPASLTYIANKASEQKTPPGRRWLYRRLYRKIAISTAAVARLNGHEDDVDRLLKHSKSQRFVDSSLGLLAVKFLSLRSLEIVRKRRSRAAKS